MNAAVAVGSTRRCGMRSGSLRGSSRTLASPMASCNAPGDTLWAMTMPADAPPQSAADDAGFLQGLGERLRLIRARRGMSRRILSHQADVSERYIAQMEAGDGNVD